MYSFWADEAYISGIAARLVLGKLSLFQALAAPGVTYQKLNMLTVAASFRLFGISEFTARLPSIMIYMVGIAVMFLLAKRLSNVYGGVVATFLYTFSHLNLAYATQAKPYIALEVITLMIVYLIDLKAQRGVWTFAKQVTIIVLLTIAFFLHYIGLFLWILYGVHLLTTIRLTNIKKITLTPLAIGVCILVVPILYVFIKEVAPIVIYNIVPQRMFAFNHLYQSVKLFAYKYTFITASAACGYMWVARRDIKRHIPMLVFALALFASASFTIYIFNIRYVLPLFGILFLYFGIFWGRVGERVNVQTLKRWNVRGDIVVPIIVLIIVYITGYKTVRWPQAYYNPNIDKYGDVQIAN